MDLTTKAVWFISLPALPYLSVCPKTLPIAIYCVLHLKLLKCLHAAPAFLFPSFLNPCALSPSTSPPLSLKFAQIIYLFHRNLCSLMAHGACPPGALSFDNGNLLRSITTSHSGTGEACMIDVDCSWSSTSPLCSCLSLFLPTISFWASFPAFLHSLMWSGLWFEERRLNRVRGFSMLAFLVNDFISTLHAEC